MGNPHPVYEHVVSLNHDELARRIEAARVLRGLSQADVNERFEKLGAGKQTAGRVERGNKPFEEMHEMLFARVLNVPVRWFTEPDVDVIIGLKPPAVLTPGELAEILARLQAGHDQATGQSPLGTQTPRADGGRPPGGPGGNGA